MFRFLFLSFVVGLIACSASGESLSLDAKVKVAKEMLQKGGDLSIKYLKIWNGENNFGKPIQVLPHEDSEVAQSFLKIEAKENRAEVTTLAKINRKKAGEPFDVLVRSSVESKDLAMVVPHEITHIQNRMKLEPLLEANPTVFKRYIRAQIAFARGALTEFEKLEPEDAANVLRLAFCEEFNAFQLELQLSKEGLLLHKTGVVARAMKSGSKKTIGRLVYEAYIEPHRLKKTLDVGALEAQCRKYPDTAEMALALFGGGSESAGVTKRNGQVRASGL